MPTMPYDIAILANAPTQAETLLHSLERHFHTSISLKLVDKFTYLGSSVTSRHGQLSIDYRSYGSHTCPIKWNTVSSKQRSCRYCYMDALHGFWLNGWRKSLTATTQECREKFWISPGGNTRQSSSWTATCLPSRKLSKLDEPDMQDTTGEAGKSS